MGLGSFFKFNQRLPKERISIEMETKISNDGEIVTIEKVEKEKETVSGHQTPNIIKAFEGLPNFY